MKNLLALCLLVFIAIYTTACCKDRCQDPSNPACENYDACYGRTTLSADFNIRNYYRINDYSTFNSITDTILFGPEGGGGVVNCIAKDTLSDIYDYSWRIGTDNRRWRTASFALGFDYADNPSLLYSTLPITLTVRKHPLTNCSTDVDTVVTVTKNVYFTGEYEALYVGTYEFQEKTPPFQTWTGSISFERPSPTSTGSKMIQLTNVTRPGCVFNTFGANTIYGYKAFILGFTGFFTCSCSEPNLYSYTQIGRLEAEMLNANTIKIDIQLEQHRNTHAPYIYEEIATRQIIGRRIL